MTNHIPLPVAGYTEQPKLAIELVNQHKRMEEVILARLDNLPQIDPEVDPRWLAIARTHIEQGFMAMNRAVFRPQRLSK
jgi:hypothetical protein